ncbi:MAG: ribonuclease E/G, partial [Acidobacteria bacterium]|nr:ribonuclease E/G [Acidobacteriota bacterium]
LVINQTEALVAIDINTGKYVGKKRLEDTVLQTNLEAVKEVVRQIRLRDLGGIIVIDFIDMEEAESRRKVVEALTDELAKDRAKTQLLQISEFGLVELTRQRVKQSLERTLCQPCPYCHGNGLVKSVDTVCLEILREVNRMRKALEGRDVMVRTNPAVSRALQGDARAVENTEHDSNRRIFLNARAVSQPRDNRDSQNARHKRAHQKRASDFRDPGSTAQQAAPRAQKRHRRGGVARQHERQDPEGCIRLPEPVPISQDRARDPDRQNAAYQRDNDGEPAIGPAFCDAGPPAPWRYGSRSRCIIGNDFLFHETVPSRSRTSGVLLKESESAAVA